MFPKYDMSWLRPVAPCFHLTKYVKFIINEVKFRFSIKALEALEGRLHSA